MRSGFGLQGIKRLLQEIHDRAPAAFLAEGIQRETHRADREHGDEAEANFALGGRASFPQGGNRFILSVANGGTPISNAAMARPFSAFLTG